MKLYEDIEAKRILIRPFDKNFTDSKIETMKFLIEETDAIIGYTQSDEISLILSDNKESFYKGPVSKLNSVIASMATVKFNELIHKYYPEKNLWLSLIVELGMFQIEMKLHIFYYGVILIILKILFRWLPTIYIVKKN